MRAKARAEFSVVPTIQLRAAANIPHSPPDFLDRAS
jgi:hypothetical protein